MTEETLILKSLVGSRAHGTNTEDSDFDWRGVFVTPTNTLLWQQAMGQKIKANNWIEGDQDNTSYEVGHFLRLGLQSNPHVLETLASPQIEHPERSHWGFQLEKLFPKLWSTKKVVEAFGGYNKKQLKNFIEDTHNRRWKYAYTFLRTVDMGVNLLRHGTMSLKVEGSSSSWKDLLIQIKHGQIEVGRTLEMMEAGKERLIEAGRSGFQQEADVDAVREFLLDLRHNF